MMDNEITIKIDGSMYKQLEKESKENNVSIEKIILRALKRWIVLRIIKEIEDSEDEKENRH